MYFRSDGLPKTWLDQCVKNLVSENPSKSHMLKAPKNCSNLMDRPFTIFLSNLEVKCPTKSLC